MTMRSLRACVFAGVGTLAMLSFACSFSDSSESFSDSSDSSASSSRSSTSSSPSSSSAQYRQDVESYTQAYVTSGGGPMAFMAGIGELAARRGISDWESKDETWTGIGAGLGRTRVDDVQLAVYEKDWANGDPEKTRLMRKGFHDAR
jgi:hypothetical protein